MGKFPQLFCLPRRHVGHTNFGTWGLANSIRALTLWLPVRGLEVPQQPVESFLIHVLHLPAPKVPNVPGIANQRWPARLQGHDRVVDSDREQNGGALLAFPCQGGFYLLLDLLTGH